ncbi:MAG: heavy metal translocating P-type ATPase [Planctomycetota bacterium]|jgi:Cu2+-exporting ATPase|nr:heavy metal translocating P-type ATPase [Planctomycetota bacterium]
MSPAAPEPTDADLTPAPSTVCTHCGLEVPPGLRAAAGQAQFCCSGCATVYAMLKDSGMDDFYRLRDSGGVLRPEDQLPGATEPEADDYDGPAFQQAFVHDRGDGTCELDWHVGGLHCAACVWLLEQLPRITPGVRAARVDFGANRLRLIYDAATVSPAKQARAIARLGYRAHPWGDRSASDAARAERRSWMLRFAVSAASAMSTMHLSLSLFAGRETGDMSAMATRGFAGAALLAASPALLYGAWPFYRTAIAGFRLRRATIEQSVLLVVVLGTALSVVNIIRGAPEVYADAMSMFIAFLLGGRLALVTAREKVAGGAGHLHGLLPPEARRLRADDSVEAVVPDSLSAGDRVLVKRGDLTPADGEVLSGEADLDVAVLTGEARPLRLTVGDRINAGCRLIDGELTMRCEAAGAGSRMGRLLAAVREGSWQPTERSKLVDRLTTWYAPTVTVMAVFTWLLWRSIDPTRALDQAMALVLACCPCALGLATPLAYALAVRRAAKGGLVIQDGGAVETLAAPQFAVLDKTGTLTAGRFQVVAWEWLDQQVNQAAIESAVLAAEARSRHPIGPALAAWLAERGTDAAPIENFEELPGKGLRCHSALGTLLIGSPHFVGLHGDQAVAGASMIGIACNGSVVARISLRDPLKPGADDLVACLRAAGAEVHLLSGDETATTTRVGAELGFDPTLVHGAQSPEDKARYVAALAERGATVMIGDGINDRLALDAAHVGIGLRGGMEAVMACCQVYVADPKPDAIPRLLAGSRATTAVLRRALDASIIYNVIAIAAVLAGVWGPYVCAVAMPVSSVLTILYLTQSKYFRS